MSCFAKVTSRSIKTIIVLNLTKSGQSLRETDFTSRLFAFFLKTGNSTRNKRRLCWYFRPGRVYTIERTPPHRTDKRQHGLNTTRTYFKTQLQTLGFLDIDIMFSMKLHFKQQNTNSLDKY